MVAPVLTDLEYQYLDSGLLLNGGSVLPFFDVESIVGFDLPDVKRDQNDIDGSDGAFIFAQFVTSRLWVITGSAYGSATATDATSIDAYIEALQYNFFPRSLDGPFYVKKGGGLSQKISYCKPVGFKYNYDAGRRIGIIPVTIQLEASDPLLYEPDQSVAFVGGVNQTIHNTGTAITYPTYQWNGAALVFGIGLVASVSIAALTGSGGTAPYTLDMGMRRIQDNNGVDYSQFINNGAVWDGLYPDISTSGSGNAVSASVSGTLVYANAWR